MASENGHISAIELLVNYRANTDIHVYINTKNNVSDKTRNVAIMNTSLWAILQLDHIYNVYNFYRLCYC